MKVLTATCMISNHNPPKSKRSNNGAADSNASIESVSNKGPLLTSTLAMFGPNSWIDLVRRYPDLYGNRTINTQQSDSICLDLAPLTRILNRWTTVNSSFAVKNSAFVVFTKCITIESLSTKEASKGTPTKLPQNGCPISERAADPEKVLRKLKAPMTSCLMPLLHQRI